MTFDYKRELDPDLKRDLGDIIQKVDNFANEKDSVLLSLLRQKRLPELFEKSQN